MKKGIKIKFWTNSEDSMLKTCMTKFKNGNTVAKWAAPKLNRTESSVQQRVSFLTYNPNPKYRVPGEKRTYAPRVQKPTESKGIAIPQGFTFDIKPSKAVMYSDHVRLYF